MRHISPNLTLRTGTHLLRFTVLMAIASCLPAATLTINGAATDLEYFNDWTHHNGQFLSDPVYATGIFDGGGAFVGMGYGFRPGIANALDRGFATASAPLWDTGTLGQVASVHVSWNDAIFDDDGSIVRSGSAVWNSTTNEFFFAFVNGMTTSLEHADRVLTPSADYCRLEANGSCSAITGFGNGILQFGFVLEADITSVVSSGTVAYVRDFSTVVSSEVPEPATGLLVLAAGLVWRLRRGRR